MKGTNGHFVLDPAAKRIVESIRKSARECASHFRSTPTWTGQRGTAGKPADHAEGEGEESLAAKSGGVSASGGGSGSGGGGSSSSRGPRSAETGSRDLRPSGLSMA